MLDRLKIVRCHSLCTTEPSFNEEDNDGSIGRTASSKLVVEDKGGVGEVGPYAEVEQFGEVVKLR